MTYLELALLIRALGVHPLDTVIQQYYRWEGAEYTILYNRWAVIDSS